MTREITVTLKFSEQDLNELLDECHFGEGAAPRVEQLSTEEFALLAQELQATAGNFVEEIVLGSREAAANDWLQDFMEEVSGQ